jgi:membrane fusion protein (multidrug efflux system)
MDRVLGWLFAAGLVVAIVVGTGFTHPGWLPAPVHAYLLSKGLAKPLPPVETAAAAPRPAAAAATGQGSRPAPSAGASQAGRPAGGAPAQRPIAVEATPVIVGPARATLTAVGSLTADERVDITSEVEGRVTEIAFQEGADVAAGAVLFRLDDQAARASVAQTAADLALAEANFARADQLSQQKIGTDKARDETRFGLDRARANADLAKVNLDKTVIRAPFAGRTGLRKVSLGNYVTRGMALVSLQSIDPIKVDFRLPETELANVALGNHIAIEVDALPGRRFAGEVFAIDPQVDVNGRAIQLRARIANDDRALKPGLFARVELVTAERLEAVQVPESAIVSQGRDRLVYVVRDGRAQPVKVSLGIRVPGRVEVTEGLKRGDVVVVSGQQRLRPGAPVDIVGAGPSVVPVAEAAAGPAG